MNANAWLQSVAFLALVLFAVKPLGAYMARVYDGRAVVAARILGPVERALYRLMGTTPDAEMTWTSYAYATMAFNVAGVLAVYGLQRAQGWAPLPGNPQGLGPV